MSDKKNRYKIIIYILQTTYYILHLLCFPHLFEVYINRGSMNKPEG